MGASEVLAQRTLGGKDTYPGNSRAFAKKYQVHFRVPGHPPGHPPWHRTLSQNPATRPMHTAASGRLSAPWFKDREALTGSERKPGVAHIPAAPHTPPQILAPALGSSLMQQEGTDLHKFPLCSACKLEVPGTSFQEPDWNFHAQGPKLPSFHVGVQHAR